jgi:hypothetical protein
VRCGEAECLTSWPSHPTRRRTMTEGTPAKTVKRHHVEELDEEGGEWVIRHDEREDYPAKRRPTDST